MKYFSICYDNRDVFKCRKFKINPIYFANKFGEPGFFFGIEIFLLVYVIFFQVKKIGSIKMFFKSAYLLIYLNQKKSFNGKKNRGSQNSFAKQIKLNGNGFSAISKRHCCYSNRLNTLPLTVFESYYVSFIDSFFLQFSTFQFSIMSV